MSGNNRATQHQSLPLTTSLWLPDTTFKSLMQFKKELVGGKALASLGTLLAFTTQEKIWFVSHHQTQTFQYITFPLGLCRLCHHQPRFCNNNNQSSFITFQEHDLNDIVRAPKTD